jgi:acetyl esterase/lipase
VACGLFAASFGCNACGGDNKVEIMIQTTTKFLVFAALAMMASGQDMRAPPPDTLSPATRAAMERLLAQPVETVTQPLAQRRAVAEAVQANAAEQLRKMYDVAVAESEIASVRVRIFTPSNMPRDNAGLILINLHGGGFIVDSGSLTESIPIAALAKIKVVSVLYRLSPENAFPAAVDDAIAVYRELLKTHQSAKIGLYGTSAGAILTAEVIARLRHDRLPQPAAIGFFSGTADFSTMGDSARFLTDAERKGAAAVMNDYIGKTTRDDSLLSPLHSDLKGFPPTLCMSSTRDILLSPTAIFHRALLRAGVDANLVVFEALPHAFWTWVPVEESREADQLQAAFFVRHLKHTTAVKGE